MKNIKNCKKSTRICTQTEQGLFSSKRSQGHVELILSFVIFIGFILAMLLLINPLKQPGTSYGVLDKIENSLLDNLSVNFGYVPLIVDANSIKKDCFQIDNSLDLNSQIIVKDSSGNIKKSKFQNSNQIYIENGSGEIYNIYVSDSFNNFTLNSGGCTPLSKNGDYSYGILVNQKILSYENLQKLNSDYLVNYLSLKNSLGFDYNFDFAVYNLTRGVLINDSLGLHPFKAGQVLSREIPLRIINENATEMDVIMLLRVW